MKEYKINKEEIFNQTKIILNEDLVEYLNKMILKYECFDRAHNIEHVKDVLEASIVKYIEYKGIYNLNLEMILTIAVYHDLGLGIKDEKLEIKEIRKNHHIYSKRIVLKDKILKNYFNEAEISIIANAVEDHRASNSSNPNTKARDIYGMIVSDADRTLDVDTIIYRYLSSKFNRKYNQLEDFNLYIEEVMEAINNKYNKETGYLKFYLPISEELEEEREKLIELVNNKELFLNKYNEINKKKKIKI